MKWFGLAQDGYNLFAFVNAEVNISFPKNWGKFLYFMIK